MSVIDGKFCDEDYDDGTVSITDINKAIAELENDKARLIEALEYANKLNLFDDAFISEQIFSKRQALTKLKNAFAEMKAT